jgi:hypothetical protein
MSAALEALEPLAPEARQRALQWLAHRLDVKVVPAYDIDGLDIEALAFLVQMWATKDAQDDLKSIMGSMGSRRSAALRGDGNASKDIGNEC